MRVRVRLAMAGHDISGRAEGHGDGGCGLGRVRVWARVRVRVRVGVKARAEVSAVLLTFPPSACVCFALARSSLRPGIGSGFGKRLGEGKQELNISDAGSPCQVSVVSGETMVGWQALRRQVWRRQAWRRQARRRQAWRRQRRGGP